MPLRLTRTTTLWSGTIAKTMDLRPPLAPEAAPAPAPAPVITAMVQNQRDPLSTSHWSAANTWPVRHLSGSMLLETPSVSGTLAEMK